MNEKIIKKIEQILRSRKKFQEWALKTYIENYYICKDIQFDKIKHPPKVNRDINIKTLTNFDAYYINLDSYFTPTNIEKRWKLNFLIANNCVRRTLKDILKQLKQEGEVEK